MGDMIWFSDANGKPAAPPEGETVFSPGPNAGIVNEIENPDPTPGTNDWYTQDGYGGGAFGSPAFGGGSYSNCSDIQAPGVAAVVNYLQALPQPIKANCESGHYYLLNNYNPGHFGDGSNSYTDHNVNNALGALSFLLCANQTRNHLERRNYRVPGARLMGTVDRMPFPSWIVRS